MVPEEPSIVGDEAEWEGSDEHRVDLAVQLGRAIKTDIHWDEEHSSEVMSGFKKAEGHSATPPSGTSPPDLIRNLDIFPAPSLPEVSPELEVPELLSGRTPLCLMEERRLFYYSAYSPAACYPANNRATDKVPWRQEELEYDTWVTKGDYMSRDIRSFDKNNAKREVDMRAKLTEPVWNSNQHQRKPKAAKEEITPRFGQVHPYADESLSREARGRKVRGGWSTETGRKRWRRKRTVFSTADIEILESMYRDHKFLNPTLKAEILSRVTVPSNVVVMWFQNRRAKDRAAGIAI